MYVSQLLNLLVGGEDVEVIVSRLPERAFAPVHRHRKFHCLDGAAQHPEPGLTHQQVHVFGHHYVPEYGKAVSPAYLLQSLFEKFLAFVSRQIREPVKATESEEMLIPAALITDKSRGHGREDSGVSTACL
jgi:hypothetical protein